jgi:hypothetical protein
MGGGAVVFGGVVTAAGLGLASASGRVLDANLTAGAVTGYLLFVLLNVFAGVALGALLQSSSIAIAASFALPAAFALLGAASKLVADWIDMSTTFNWVLEKRMGRSRAPDLGLGPLLGGGPAGRRRRPDHASRRRVAGSTGARLMEMCRRPGSHGRDRQGFVLFPPPQGGAGWGHGELPSEARRDDSGRSRGIVAGMVFPTAAGGLSPYGAGMDASSVFEVGSITKTFAATVLSEIGLSVARPTEPLRRSGSCTDPRRRPMWVASVGSEIL